MKQSPLHPIHQQLAAKMTEFQGWQVPLQFSGVAEEHLAVRTAAGLFDVSHLGRIELAGDGAAELLQKTFTRNAAKLSEGAAAYGLFCNDAGFILDDALVLHLPKGKRDASHLVTTNAVNTDKILAWLNRHAGGGVRITDATPAAAQLALQGPLSAAVLEKLAGGHFKKIRPHGIRELGLAGIPALVSRTGCTGELGFELFVPADKSEALWNAVLDAGKEHRIQPCGHAARDVLRLEMGYVLYGSDIDENRTPLEAELGAFVDLTKDFIGREALAQQKQKGPERKLAGFELFEKGIPKSGGSIYSENREIGVVTSGNHSPSVRTGIGLGYVLARYAQPGQEVEIEAKDREIAARIVDLPFYRKK